MKRIGRPISALRWLILVLIAVCPWSVPGHSSLQITSCDAATSGGKKCACPIALDEKIAIHCSSSVDDQSCGVCSVLSKDGHRDGRSCVAIYPK